MSEVKHGKFSNFGAEFLMISAAALFAFGGVLAKIVREAGMSAFRLVEIRSTGAALILLIYAVIKIRPELKLKRSEFWDMIIFSIIGVAIVQSFYFTAIKYLYVSVALIIEFTAPIWIVLYLRFIKKKSINPIMWWGVGCAFGGLLLIAQIWQGSTLNWFGVLLAFGDAIALAVYFLKAEKLSQSRSSVSLIVWGLGLSAVFWATILPWWSFPFEILNQQLPLGGNFSNNSWPGWFLILLIIIFGTIFPYLLTIAGLRKLSASTGSVIGMIEPVFAGIIAWIWLNESFNLIQLLGCAIVLFGIYLADKAKAH